MSYFHVRYTAFTSISIPIEKEEWLDKDKITTCEQLQELLISENAPASVTVSFCLQISQDDYVGRLHLPPATFTQQQIDANNFSLWNLDERSRVNRKLHKDALAMEDRYRNIDSPDPIL